MPHRARKLLALVSMLGLVIISGSALGVGQTVTPYLLFPGNNTDSTEQASRWIPVQGAQKVVIRVWSTHGAFSATGADTALVDTLIASRLLFSDSVLFIGRDSSGTLVTARSTYTPANAPTFPICADSVVVPVLNIGDSVITMFPSLLNKELRAPANGSGLLSYVQKIFFDVGNSGVSSDAKGLIGKQYMRLRVTPRRRMTPAGSLSTQGIRANGLKGFKGIAYVYREN